ncbi:hypothetical protein A3C59_05375 [Candidatus Daviesbacteria bacterium RIFCSPHIGHO2_02_FULL_36_13]|uniref:Uncharacterized protein n=1 Tax=Candidatus Daviesbacteria bacterium RIFCSPHIGHO2_02_FULL_36_13 TaxID=1797768 RepID=A0A1F5JZA8_9BACT|nr:MAG: hypothetical protein A3C59_05375 [Candidatus Daviesbacteria bacterium RIFCSPHIGHO2_02_FULL_36_13]OGE42729.1 MAG: hypothetical protein A3A45_03600 [Candidatus Daviesbacteria bacterium RIFCSPLOWO2_01_FULL_36_8]
MGGFFMAERFRQLGKNEVKQDSFDVMNEATSTEVGSINGMHGHDLRNFIYKYYRRRGKIPVGHHIKRLK